MKKIISTTWRKYAALLCVDGYLCPDFYKFDFIRAQVRRAQGYAAYLRQVVCIISAVLLLTACGNKNASAPEADSTEPVINVFGSVATGYGYTIFINGKEAIRQPHIPAINALRTFSYREDAERVAMLVRQKLMQQVYPPAVSVEELDSLGINYR